MVYREFDVVRVVALPSELATQTSQNSEAPQIGDSGTVVFMHQPRLGLELAYTVERVGQDGTTLWLADFLASEIDLVSRP
jgi:hypothetical protein